MSSSSTPAPGAGSKAASNAIKEALKEAPGQELKVKALTVKVFATCKGSIVKPDFKAAFDGLIAMGRVTLEGVAGIPQKQMVAKLQKKTKAMKSSGKKRKTKTQTKSDGDGNGGGDGEGAKKKTKRS